MKTIIKKYYNVNPFYHGIMFHHFYDNKAFKKTNSSINKKQFLKIIKYIGRENVLDPNVFIENLSKKKINSKSICLTFDDALKSQIKVALPILDKLKIKSFFFIYTDIFSPNKTNLMEPVRDFIQSKFNNFESFYDFFWKNLNYYYKSHLIYKFLKKNKLKIKKMKSTFRFYSNNEINYRLLRDNFFKIYEFNFFMKKLFKKKKYNYKKNYKKIFMTVKDINLLLKKGHSIGLHSHSHPHNLSSLTFKKQKLEYLQNLKILKNINKNFIYSSMSHPTGSYNKDSLEILKKLDIKIGFNSSISILKTTKKKINSSNLEIAREDCRNILNILEVK